METVRILIEACFSTHVYKWKGEIFKQLRGGCIGLRGTGSLARAIMAIVLEILEDLMKKAGLNPLLLKKYVDDILGVCRKLEPGARWIEGEVKIFPELREEDILAGRSKEDITF